MSVEAEANTGNEEDAQALVADAAAWIREFIEEGVADFTPLEVEPVGPGAETEPAPGAAEPARAARPPPQRPPPSRPPAVAPTAAPPDGSDTTPGVGEAMPWGDTRPTLEAVRTHLGECTRCGLSGGRQQIVFGEGNPEAELLFIGEAPGEQEDRTGRPFIGRAGELLTQMIEKGMGLARGDVYICNIVKCRPPGNRNPLPPEVGACRPFLDGQIAALAPKVIVTLGKPAASLLLGRDIAITRVRGTWHEYQGIPLMPTLHPAYVLRQYTPENRRAVWEDLRAALERSRS